MNHGAYVRRVMVPSIKAEGMGRKKGGPVTVQVCNLPNRGSEVQLYVDWLDRSQLLACGLHLTREEALLLAELLTEAATQ